MSKYQILLKQRPSQSEFAILSKADPDALLVVSTETGEYFLETSPRNLTHISSALNLLDLKFHIIGSPEGLVVQNFAGESQKFIFRLSRSC